MTEPATQRYARPPITEAVIELRFETPLAKAVIDKASRKLAAEYPLEQPINHINLTIGEVHSDRPVMTEEVVGVRRTALDAAGIVVLNGNSFVVSQLAPYPGWGMFLARFNDAWDKWKSVAGYRKISRIGVRFINRIDIPTNGKAIRVEDYLRTHVAVSDEFPHMDFFTAQISAPLQEGLRLVLNCAPMPSPLLNHTSIVLDIDVSLTNAAPQKDNEILKLLERVRLQKNDIFEASITDIARELFSK